MNKTLKVIGSCGLGGLIGTWIALMLDWRLYFIGALAGGAVSYVVCEFEKFIAAIPDAWRATTAWKPDWILLSYRFISGMASACLVFSGLFYFLVSLNFMITGKIRIIPDSEWWMLVGLLVSILFCIGWSAGGGPIDPSKMSRKDICETRKRVLNLLLITNPIVFPFWALFWIGKGIVKILWFILKAICTMPRFFWNLFIRIHSEFRFFCFVDGALGTIVGAYCFHQPIAGGIAGMAFGIINHQLVAIRWLKVQPA